jgi:hypothetical protein
MDAELLQYHKKYNSSDIVKNDLTLNLKAKLKEAQIIHEDAENIKALIKLLKQDVQKLFEHISTKNILKVT